MRVLNGQINFLGGIEDKHCWAPINPRVHGSFVVPPKNQQVVQGRNKQINQEHFW